jgi:hypothetical protein
LQYDFRDCNTKEKIALQLMKLPASLSLLDRAKKLPIEPAKCLPLAEVKTSRQFHHQVVTATCNSIHTKVLTRTTRRVTTSF